MDQRQALVRLEIKKKNEKALGGEEFSKYDLRLEKWVKYGFV